MAQKSKEDNVMRNIKVDKLVVNICVGSAGDRITKAGRVLESLSDHQKPVENKAKITIRSFSVRRGEKIAVSVTLRGKKATDLLERALKVKEYELPKSAFTDLGNFGFGIKEHIDLGLRYDPSTGIFGMDFYVVLKRPGARVARRKHCRSRVGNNQKISQEEAHEWFKKTYDGVLI